MKKLFVLSTAGVLGISALASSSVKDVPYSGSRFADVWETTQEGVYDELPRYKVTSAGFFAFLRDKLLDSALRTLTDKADTLPTFTKLLHSNGICLKGTWNITADTPYSGAFKTGTRSLIIARASSALSEVDSGQKRSLGLAGKIFPGDDESDPSLQKTANFFVIDDLAGTYNPHFRDAVMSNDISNLSGIGLDNSSNAVVAAVAGASLAIAERVTGGKDPAIRQLYPISELGEENPSQAITPRWISINAQAGDRTVIKDFRDELSLENNGGSLTFDISVTSDGAKGQEKPWRKIGYIEFTESVISEGCDRRLHFTHPKWREDLRFQ